MFYLKAKYLKSSELPEREPFNKKTFLVSLLVGTEEMKLVTNPETFALFSSFEPEEEVTLEVSARRVNLSDFGGKGNAYRLFVNGLVEDEVIS